VDPAVFNFRLGFTPNDYIKGTLALSWEYSDPGTIVVHLRQGIHWQDIPPANGREFTADDVVWDIHRMYGGGDGFTKPSPFITTVWTDLKSATAIDKYTVVFAWKTPNPEIIDETMHSPGVDTCMVNREAVQQWGDVNNWHRAIGTGAFMISDYVSGSSLTVVRNPNYWGYDERYPQNKLPYADAVKDLVIPDSATALAALRTGKIDALDNNSLTTAKDIQKTNPEIIQYKVPAGGGLSVDVKNDAKPFNDVRVRQAMQMAIDLQTISSSYYGGDTPPYPATLTTRYMTGWGFPYEQWPQDLKDQFAYNPTGAKKLLSDAGYPNGFQTNIVADNTGDLDLLQIVKSYFLAVGIDMSVKLMDNASWTTTVQNGHKYDQIAYRASGSLALNSEPTRHVLLFQTGQARNYQMISNPDYDALYAKAQAATSVDQVKEIVRQGNEIFARQHFMISLLIPNIYVLYQPWFKGFNGSQGVVAGGGAGPNMIGFYWPRLWLDQKLKQSLGH